MTIREIIQRLREEGHSVDAYKRTDGGYLIKSIDGIKYQGAVGNEVGRAMVGVSASERRISQLKSITPLTGTKRAKERKKGFEKKVMQEDLKKEIRRTQRIWRQSQAKGRITQKKIQYIAETEGEKAAYEALRKAQAYARGIAYDANIEALAERIERVAYLHPDYEREIQELANYIRSFIGKNSFKEKWISKINELFYELEEENYEYIEDTISEIYSIIG